MEIPTQDRFEYAFEGTPETESAYQKWIGRVNQNTKKYISPPSAGMPPVSKPTEGHDSGYEVELTYRGISQSKYKLNRVIRTEKDVIFIV